MNDGWIEWNGGECPIKSDKTRVEYKCGGGWKDEGRGVTLRWSNIYGNHQNIIAYRIIEDHEPAETAAPDMTQNRVIWGLLTDDERAAVHAWLNAGGKVEQWDNTNQMWRYFNVFGFEMSPSSIYRTVAPPMITEVTQECFIGCHLVTVTLHLHDGKPISGTVAV